MAIQKNQTNYKGKNHDKYRYIEFDLGGGFTYSHAVKRDVPINDAIAQAQQEASSKVNKYASNGATGATLLGQTVETQTRSKGKKSTSYEMVSVNAEPGRRYEDTRSIADLAYEKEKGIGAGNVRPGTKVAGGYVQNDGSLGNKPPQTQSPTQADLYAQLAKAQDLLNSKTRLPTTAGQSVGGVGTTNLPTPTYNSGNVTNATASVAGLGNYYDTLTKQAEDARRQADALQAQQVKDQKGLMSWLSKQPSQAQVRSDSYQNIGINPAGYFAEQRAGIAEIEALNQEYNAVQAARDQQIAATNDKLGSMNFINNQIAQIERNAAPKLNEISANINSKAATLQALQGNFAEAQSFVNQAVEDAIADQKYQLDLFKMFYDMNQDNIDRLESRYQDAFKTSLSIAEKQYDDARADKMAVGELMLDNPNAGIKITDSLDQAYSKAGINPGKPSSSSTSSRTEQILDGFISFDDLTASEAQKVRDELFAQGFGSDTPPTWFREFLDNERQMNHTPEALTAEWIAYRDGIMGGSSGGGINFDDL